MKLIIYFSLLLACCAGISLPSVQAADGQANVVCSFSHMKPDDAILMPGMPGMAMSHDFVGNRSTDAFSTAESLLLHSGTTCNNAADSTGYWAPTMMLPDGQVVNPSNGTTASV